MLRAADKPSTASEVTLDAIAHRSGEMFTLPAIAIEVVALANCPDVLASQLKETIELDPALASKLLRVVNSSLFGLSGKVSNLNQAVTLLGIKPLKMLTLGFSLPDALFDDLSERILGFYWQHALIKAVAAKELAEQVWNIPGDEAWVAGLLQDIGMLAMIQDLGEPYLQFLNRIGSDQADWVASEQQTMGFTHMDLSARLLEQWRLPRSLVLAAQCHQFAADWKSVDESCRILAQITFQAEYLAQLLADRRVGAIGHLLESEDEATRLTLCQLESLVESLGNKVTQMAELMNVGPVEERDYRQIMESAETAMYTLSAVFPDSSSEYRSLMNALERMSRTDTVLCSSSSISLSGHSADKQVNPGVGPDCSRENHDKSEQGQVDSVERKPLSADDGTSFRKLGEHAESVVIQCRQLKQPATLLFIEMSASEGRWELAQDCLKNALSSLIRDTPRTEFLFLRYTDRRIAIMLQGCDRHMSVRFAKSLVSELRSDQGVPANIADESFPVSAGLATIHLPPVNFEIHQWIESAERCLFASYTSGGNIVKSIEIF